MQGKVTPRSQKGVTRSRLQVLFPNSVVFGTLQVLQGSKDRTARLTGRREVVRNNFGSVQKTKVLIVSGQGDGPYGKDEIGRSS